MSLWNVFTNGFAALTPAAAPSLGDSPAWAGGQGITTIGANDPPSDLVSLFPQGLTFEVEAPWTPEPLTFGGASPLGVQSAPAGYAGWGGNAMASFGSLFTSLFDQADQLSGAFLPIFQESNRASEARARLSTESELAKLYAQRGQSYTLSPAASTGASLLPWSGLGDLTKYLPLLLLVIVLLGFLK